MNLLGDVIRFEPIEGIPTSLQAQVIRLLLPAYFENDVCILSDIDMIPLSKSYFVDSIASAPEDSFVIYRDAAYGKNDYRYPMCYMAGKGKTYKEIFKIDNVSDIPNIIVNWHALNLGWDTDERLLYTYLKDWESDKNKCICLGHGVSKRIDRSSWKHDAKLLVSGHYIDAHCPRPYSKYKTDIEDIVTKLKAAITVKKLTSRSELGVGSHMASLVTMVMNTDGPVLEMGSGDFSTPLLHAVCSRSKRFLLTTDTDKKWLNYFIDLETEWHAFQYIPVYEDDWSRNPKPQQWDQVGTDRHWSVVFVDHRPGKEGS